MKNFILSFVQISLVVTCIAPMSVRAIDIFWYIMTGNFLMGTTNIQFLLSILWLFGFGAITGIICSLIEEVLR